MTLVLDRSWQTQFVGPPMDDSDDELFARAHTGDSHAYNVLAKRSLALLSRWFAGRLDSSLHVDDLAVDSFERAYGAHTPAKGRFRPFLYMVARHRLTDHFRMMDRQRRLVERSADRTAMEGIEPIDPTSVISVAETEGQILDWIQSRIETRFAKNANQRRIFVAVVRYLADGECDVDGVAITQIELASSLDCRPEYVSRARKILREWETELRNTLRGDHDDQ